MPGDRRTVIPPPSPPGIIAHADLSLGADVGPVLDAHMKVRRAAFRAPARTTLGPYESIGRFTREPGRPCGPGRAQHKNFRGIRDSCSVSEDPLVASHNAPQGKLYGASRPGRRLPCHCLPSRSQRGRASR
jgi:hypothetical protein